MAPGWVRISQLHMKEERQRVGKSSERVRVYVDCEEREPSCFDHRSSVWIGAPDGQTYRA